MNEQAKPTDLGELLPVWDLMTVEEANVIASAVRDGNISEVNQYLLDVAGRDNTVNTVATLAAILRGVMLALETVKNPEG